MRSGSAFEGMSRRGFLGFAGAAAATAALAGCTGGGSGRPEALMFWNMPMGNPEFADVDKQIVKAYKPAEGLSEVKYQLIQWTNFTQTFATAVASGTGPAVSSGGGTQVFKYAAKGKIAYADDLVANWKTDGLADDFLPGLLDALKMKDGHQAAIPQNLDMIVLWSSPALMAKAGAKVPTDWQSYLDAAAALKKIGVFGFGTGAGAGNFQGGQVLVSWMIMNGGGLFDEDQKPNCVTARNIEAVDFVLEMVKKGYVDPGSTQYTNANVASQWNAGRFGLGFDVMNLAGRAGAEFDGVVGSPLTGPSGDKGTLSFINNIMMWKDTPSQKSSEAFLTYYYQHMKPLWTKGTMQALPPLKSIVQTDEFQADENHVKVVEEWQPIAKTWAAPGSRMSAAVTAVDGTTPMQKFAQSVLGGEVDAKSALSGLQRDLEEFVSTL